jgi:sterol desaturase/sphingolipid hydroxylase (fatty acid hydroxylase superfamily)
MGLDLSPGLMFFWNQASKLLFSLGSHFSFTSLGAALLIATMFYAAKRLKRGRKLRGKTILRALFPKRITANPSNYADLGYLFFNVFVFGIVFGWAVLTYQTVTNGIISGLVGVFGQPSPAMLPPLVSRAIVTLILFLAYELGYWFNHWLCHRVPLLWEFHKVHHSAEVLTPLTNFRVHPVYAWVFANILALSAAIANGFGNYAFGDTTYQYAFEDSNIILVLFIHTYVHLQHSHVWIAFSGWCGRVFVSPAHHQIHHSKNPKHFNCNYGSCLALWDWMFGTLYVPAKEREKLSFGVEQDEYPAHTITGELVAPFIRAWRVLRGAVPLTSSSRRARSA